MNHPHVQLCMPTGPLGAIVKPMEWRKHNDSKSFIKNWLEFITPLKMRRRCIMSIQQWYWEREKNEMRRIWFGLSKFEQDRYFSMRDTDKTISNIVVHMMKDFKGPKYQQGNFSMFPAGTTSITAGGATLSLSSGNNFATNVDISPPSALDAGFGAQRNGDFERVNSSGTNNINTSTDWIKPATITIGDSYEIKWNAITGSAVWNDENYTEDTWSTITTLRYVGKSTSGIASPHTMELDIGDDGTSTSDVNQDYVVEAGDLI